MRYRIDADDHIVSIDHENWDRFATANDAAELSADSVLNYSLYDYIIGHTTRHLTQLLIAQVRSGKGPFNIPYRCDSPDKRRYMQMHISAVDEGSVEFCSCLLREEDRDPVLSIDRKVEHGEEMLTVCSWCKKAEVQSKEWMEIEDAIRALRLFDDVLPPDITHGMCPQCLEDSLSALK